MHASQKVELRHVLWIGGPPGSGKTTIAVRLARRYGLRWYSADAHTWQHRDQALAARNPHAIRWEELGPRKRWEQPGPDLLAMSLHTERPAMIADDLRRLPTSPLMVAEGTTVMPELAAAGIAAPERAVWLLPSEEFQRARIAERDWPAGPKTLYELVTSLIADEVSKHDVPTVHIDASRGVDDVLAIVEAMFGDALAEGPRATAVEERRALLRYANEAVVEQVRGFFARPWADGDPDTVVRSFLCECGETACEETVEIEVGAAAAEAVIAATCPTRR